MTEYAVESSARAVVDLNENRPIRVLHVDDEASFLKITKQCLEMQGPFQVDTASSVEEAFEKLRKETYDAVVSDYQMPGKDGLEFLKELNQKGNNVPFIIFTGKGREEVAVKALNLGADQYLSKAGEPEAVYCELEHSIRQVVTKKKAEHMLTESEARLRQITDNTLDMICLCDMKGIFKYVSPSHKRILGYETSALLGKSIFEFVHPDDVKKAMETIQEAKDSNSWSKMIFRCRHAAGHYLWLECSGNFVLNNDGQPTGAVLTSRDITDRKRTEEALVQSEAKYRLLIEQSLQGIGIAQGVPPRLVFTNPAMSEISGYSPEELASISLECLIHPDDQAVFFSRLKERFEGKLSSTNEYKVIRKDGTLVRIALASSRIEYNGKPAVQATFIDITERKKSEEELRRFSTSVRMSPDGVVTGDLNGNITDLNEAALRMYGSTDKKDVIGMNILDILIESDRPRALQDMAENAKTGQGKPIEYSCLTKNDTVVPVERAYVK